jgi:hypothetical protein
MKLQGSAPGQQMPLGLAPLSDEDLNNIVAWINAGAASN